ncbi:hypothetical protein WMY93_017340 [Mugilogobius chulae]|uniref:Uncharacterized protein n=1 Tax=Mugilogobius chulae TaxID=88201 RepID=A0AAW0NP34_9GOBI
MPPHEHSKLSILSTYSSQEASLLLLGPGASGDRRMESAGGTTSREQSSPRLNSQSLGQQRSPEHPPVENTAQDQAQVKVLLDCEEGRVERWFEGLKRADEASSSEEAECVREEQKQACGEEFHCVDETCLRPKSQDRDQCGSRPSPQAIKTKSRQRSMYFYSALSVNIGAFWKLCLGKITVLQMQV